MNGNRVSLFSFKNVLICWICLRKVSRKFAHSQKVWKRILKFYHIRQEENEEETGGKFDLHKLDNQSTIKTINLFVIKLVFKSFQKESKKNHKNFASLWTHDP